MTSHFFETFLQKQGSNSSPLIFELQSFPLHQEKLFFQMPNLNVVPVFDVQLWNALAERQDTEFESVSLNEVLESHKNGNGLGIGICVVSEADVKAYSSLCSFFYIPGDFCRQADVLDAVVKSGKPVLVERGNFLSPADISRLCEKLSGSDFLLVECGSSNGYSDSILDPRALHMLAREGRPFGINLSDLLCRETAQYSHRPYWLNDKDFISAFIKAGKSFGASFYVFKSHGKGALTASLIGENL